MTSPKVIRDTPTSKRLTPEPRPGKLSPSTLGTPPSRPGARLSSDSQQDGQDILEGCHNLLKELDVIIVKYNSLASGNTPEALQRFKLSIAEDITPLRDRLISNTTLLSSFILLDNAPGLRRATSLISVAGSINTKKEFKELCKDLFECGATAEMIKSKRGEIRKMFKSQNAGTNTIADQGQLLEVNSSDATTSHIPPVSTTTNNPIDVNSVAGQSQLLEVGNPSDATASHVSTVSTEDTQLNRTRSTFGWVRPQIDFLVGPLMLSAAEGGNTKRLISTLEYVQDINFVNGMGETALHLAAGGEIGRAHV